MAANIKEAEKRIARGSARSSYKYLLIGQCRTLSSIDVKGHGQPNLLRRVCFFLHHFSRVDGGYKSVRVCIVLKPHNLLHSSFFEGLELRRGDAIVATTLDTAQISKRYRR